ncbi:hypothetical protein RF11_15322 [Thelohanellus kitauei]|uniref:Uncharacterized protein n=1 Tax=Thelohanellus kitauei TaxID=669202 RepID=A0A0C2N706_THEKT|nr:hypothetical protein RF11_11271 [Thelohanellus kitauei]KII72085.1 hypothetical protein RF11_15322 [Thelohanellus kitauei]
MVNHREAFWNQLTGANTNTIKGNWIRDRSHRQLKGTKLWMYRSYFMEYSYRQIFHEEKLKKKLGRCLDHIRDVYNTYSDCHFVERLKLMKGDIRMPHEPQAILLKSKTNESDTSNF